MTNSEVLRELVNDGSAGATSPLAGIDSFMTDMLPAILVASIIITVIFGIFAVIICCKNRTYITVIHEYIIAADRSLWRPLSQALRIGIVVATLTLIMQLVL